MRTALIRRGEWIDTTHHHQFDGAFVYRLGHQVFILRRGVRLPYALPEFLGVVKWYHPTFGTLKRKFDSCHRDQLIMHRWRSGPTHGIANPENREFKSHSVLQFVEASIVKWYNIGLVIRNLQFDSV